MNAPPPFPGTAAPTRRRRWPALVAVILLGALIVTGLWPRAQPVEITAASRGPLRVTVEDEGVTRVINRYVVAAPVSGLLRRIPWKPGAPVEAGKTVLAVLETAEGELLDASRLAQAEARVRAATAAQGAAQAQLERAAAALFLAKAEAGRIRSLWAQGAVTQQDLEVAEMRERVSAQDHRAAEFSLQVAEYEREQAEAVLARGRPGGPGSAATVTLVAPVNGRVLRVHQESERIVPAGFALLEIGDPSDLEVRVEALSRDAVLVRPGARVLLEQWGGEQPLEARVRWVEPSGYTKISALGVEEQRVNVIADLVSPPDARPTLGDAFRVEARIVVWENPDVLRVSSGALFQRAGEWRTFVISGGRARERTVRPGRSNGVLTEIVDGVAPGEKLVMYPGDKVTDGRRVAGLEIGRP
jgi:HlyD family secretion protein